MTRQGILRLGLVALLLVVTVSGGSAAASAATLSWSTPALIDNVAPLSAQPMIRAVSCPSARLCVGVEASGVVTTTDPTGGPGAWHLTSFAGLPGYSNAVLGAVSCPSAHLCVVADDVGDVLTSTHPTGGAHAWKVTRVSQGLAAVSCPTTRLCVALAGDSVMTSTNPTGGPRTWKRSPDPSVGPLTSIDCASVHLCVAAGVVADTPEIATATKPAGGVRAWKVRHLSSPGLNLAFSGVACPSQRLCVVTDAAGNVLTSRNPTGPARAWKPRRVPGVDRTVACPSPRLCVSVSPSDVTSSTNPGGRRPVWRAATLATPLSGVVAVTCGSVRSCVAVDWGDDILTTTQPTRGAGAWTRQNLGQGFNSFTGASCTAPALCVAVDSAGNVLSSSNSSAAAATWNVAALGQPLVAVSCPTSGFCAAASNQAVFTTTDPTSGPSSWTPTQLPDSPRLIGISCASAELCVASDESGNIETSIDPAGGAGTWTTTMLGQPPTCDKYECTSDPIQSVSCPSDQFCAATDGSTLFTSTNPSGGASAWSKGSIPADSSHLSCPTPSLCVVSHGETMDITTNPDGPSPTWTTVTLPSEQIPIPAFGAFPASTIPPLISSLACPTTNSCTAVDSHGGYAFTGDPSDPSTPWVATKIDSSVSSLFSGPLSLTAVSCTPADTCLAVDGGGRAVIGQPAA